MKILLLAGFLLVGCATGQAETRKTLTDEKPAALDNDRSTVADILARFDRAVGAESLSAMKTVERTGTLIRGESGGIPLKMVTVLPDQWYYNQIFAFGDQVTYRCDGRDAWVHDSRGETPLTPALCLDLQMLLGMPSAAELAKIYPEMSLANDGRNGDTKTAILRARSRDGIRTDLVFDRQSGLLLQAGNLFFEDHRREGGYMLPHRIWIGSDSDSNGLRMKMEIAQVRIGELTDHRPLERPECPLPNQTPPLYTPRKQIPVSRESLLPLAGVYRHPSDTKVQYIVSLQGDHLMLERTGWGRRMEIRPESDIDFFMRFQNQEFHFIKDRNGKVLRLEIGADRKVKAEKIR